MNYTLLNRYIINASLGMESNSTMGKSERFGMFPTVGLAWHLADEKFMDFRMTGWMSSNFVLVWDRPGIQPVVLHSIWVLMLPGITTWI